MRACLTDKQLYKPHVTTLDQIYKKNEVNKKRKKSNFPGHFNNGNTTFLIKKQRLSKHRLKDKKQTKSNTLK